LLRTRVPRSTGEPLVGSTPGLFLSAIAQFG
jgi:hypothetical protein